MIGFVFTFVSTMILALAIPAMTLPRGDRQRLYDALTLLDHYENNEIQSLDGQDSSLTPTRYFIGYGLPEPTHKKASFGGRRSRMSDVGDLGFNQLDDTDGSIILLKKNGRRLADKCKPTNTVGGGNYFY